MIRAKRNKNHLRINNIITAFILTIAFFSCGDNSKTTTTTTNTTSNLKVIKVNRNEFNPDSAYKNIETQLSFGYRIPGTKEHKKCSEWLLQTLKRYCDTTYLQATTTKTFDGSIIPVYNILGSFNPNAEKRLLLASHWDSRPYADEDDNHPNKPVPGANDGGSGVGILLELSRVLKESEIDFGIDILFFDAEDLGKSQYPNSFCLGSQIWSKTPHIVGYKADVGILLDMVGGANAEFYWEGNSSQWGYNTLAHVWTIAQELGHGNNFLTKSTAPIIDDHIYVQKFSGIPMIDIIDYNSQDGFADHWHTVDDDLNAIDKNTLHAVGSTLEHFIFNPTSDLKQ